MGGVTPEKVNLVEFWGTDVHVQERVAIRGPMVHVRYTWLLQSLPHWCLH